MMGSPYYYDIFFDPGDVFHDCMWSGICTCCIQLVHQGPQVNESQDLILCHQPAFEKDGGALLLRDQDLPDKPAKFEQHLEKLEYNNNNSNNISNNNSNNKPVKQPHNFSNNNLHQHQHHLHQQIISDNYPKHATSPDNINSSSSSHSNSSSTSSSSASTPSPSSSSPPNCSNSTSPKPIRRREHNDSERKRRDHLRNAFNFLRDQVPRFKAINKKPPRIQILHEATKYVQAIMREHEDLERRLLDERAKHERLKLT